jgi:hypothetical protein
MNRINGNTMISRILILCAALAIQFSAPIRTGAQTPSGQAGAEDLKTVDDFFNNPDNLSLSNCDKATWNLVHQAARTVYTHNLPPSSIDDDLTRVEQIDKCAEKADKERNNLIQILNQLNQKNMKEIAALGETRYSHPDAEANARALFNIESNTSKHDMFLDWYMTQQIVYVFAHNASQMYMNQAYETRYRNLVERYNALANSLANVRLAQGYSFAIQPRPLHCDASTNSATGVTQMDCQ